MSRAQSLITVVIATCALGCSHWIPSGQVWVGSARKSGYDLLTQPQRWIKDFEFSKGRPSTQTVSVLRQLDLDGVYSRDPVGARRALADHFAWRPQRSWAYALAELCLLESRSCPRKSFAERNDANGRALEYAYAYLFAKEIVEPPNPLDPRMRLACDIYNAALASLLEDAKRTNGLDPRRELTVETSAGKRTIPIEHQGFAWSSGEFDRLEWTNKPTSSELGREVRGYGLGVPMVGVRRQKSNSGQPRTERPEDAIPGADGFESFLIGSHPFAVTVLLKPDISGLFAERPNYEALDGADEADAIRRRHQRLGIKKSRKGEPSPWMEHGSHVDGGRPSEKSMLQLLDPRSHSTVSIDGQTASIEADLSAPIVYALRTAPNRSLNLLGFLDPGRAEKLAGLVMLEPYQPGKIPVVLVHGLLSDPFTWTEMLNELGSDPEIQKHYQFWAFYYPTGLPFLKSAAKLRLDLEKIKQSCDPKGLDASLSQTVLVGHSMGGLVAKLQVAESGEGCWNLISKKPFSELKSSPETREALRQVFFFEPEKSVRRVIYLGTPHRGSAISKAFIGRLGSWLVRVPRMLLDVQKQLIADNPDAFQPVFSKAFPTSVDTLAPNSPMLQVMCTLEVDPGVKEHTILGDGEEMGRDGRGDGVVPASSAHLENAESELRIQSPHESVHRHPRAILEVKRILRIHYRQSRAVDNRRQVVPALGICEPSSVVPVN